MVTEQKSPSTTETIEKGWVNPTRAYASDDLRTACSTSGAVQEYGGYGFNVPSNAEINEVLAQIEGYETDPDIDTTSIQWFDGETWRESLVPFTTEEQFFSKDITAWIDTPAKLNALKMRIRYVILGACFPPQSEFLSFDGKNFGMIKVEDIRVGDLLLGRDEDRTFKPAKVTTVKTHVGIWQIIRAYLKYPKSYVNATCKNPQLRKLFNLTPNAEVLCDAAWTDNHPVYTQNRGQITAGELKVGDILGELFWDQGVERDLKLCVGGIEVEMIEKYEHKGTVYDIKGESKWIFGRHLIGHLTKEPW